MSTVTIARRLVGAGALGGVLVASLTTAAFACERGSARTHQRATSSHSTTLSSRSTDDTTTQRHRSTYRQTGQDRTGGTATGASVTSRSGTSRSATSESATSGSATSGSAGQVSSSGSSGGSCTASMYDEPQLTATGEQFNPQALTAASRTLPLNSTATVTNPTTGKSVTVRINDRGPYVGGRCIDLSAAAFAAIGDPGAGLMQVNVSGG